MMTLNLASEDIKREIKLRKIFGMIGGMIYLLIYLVIIFSVILFYTKLLLKVKLDNINEQTNIITTNSQKYNEKISKINYLIQTTGDIQKDYVSWTCLIKKVAQKYDGIILTSISFDKNKKIFIVRGHAATRDNLINYKSYLENLGYFSKTELPLNYLSSKDNIDFEINTALYTDKLNQLKDK